MRQASDVVAGILTQGLFERVVEGLRSGDSAALDNMWIVLSKTHGHTLANALAQAERAAAPYDRLDERSQSKCAAL